ncbi:hypothetical protein BFJ63_vAg10646 [Fusarium oxysporum f. sp. narcissi]|uniref:Uncharacterized protein n=4 Tax=Fusarium oxysporum TaxID=5507 RepID=A0A420QVE5_FUSOX|nr:hypothetical protein BFJ65_g18026 [Fusarium oxysporum f. sp. cepae]RKL08773.1 hypothetical protein BFJ68_g9263 [Fusarium oxysporum]RYC86504.1 hypothetical protein BFJ63_vAg10646 [Fusarium oxysporum f. sp. narcissi]RKK31263.1 hypothetical protein BFJ67_g15317 [Fusarium oxysporum f. sp. cepae]RKK32488.1 hypothetical protein BFJ66_g15338 [Fusarium oxysporum f. sp. cepae]
MIILVFLNGGSAKPMLGADTPTRWTLMAKNSSVCWADEHQSNEAQQSVLVPSTIGLAGVEPAGFTR